ncbi:LexA-binding, inner membrane-associated putative hydrolase [Halopelagius inordinatus]|uniref:LexA-binding, inner membrane-associated putative hydrolase n=1 Tax=Halopelagius inordinatus TaxID=553467 RepID=A0A1I2MKX0_9EURY|nr:metal-dependent hydrolase [Halopelagius inordinatus]SFF91738.1 LexA-binding, inner membrane-associated putative hydrolase [Halopelagius inordinatus]
MNKDGHVLNAALLAVGLGVVLSVDPTAGPILDDSVADTLLGAGRMVVELSLPVVLGALFPDVDTAFGRHRKTLHNLPVLALFVGFPLVFGNLEYVWIGVATHYLLDMVGSKRGIALFYPFSPTEYDLPTGVATSSKWATVVTVVVTAFELVALALVHYFVFALDTTIVEMMAMVGV